MDKRTRYTIQMRQEEISRHQLAERLVTFGWSPVAPKDLGEDFIVHIYFEGRATGVTFYVQEKSITNLAGRRSGDRLVYDIEVNDLKHWEAFSLPVVLIVWDIKLREGRWVLVNNVIAELDRRLPQWREKKRVRVHIPWNNTTDDAGLVQLRQWIGHHLFPVISRSKTLDMDIELRFPDTEEGKEAWKAFKRFRKGGEQTKLTGVVVREKVYSDWAIPWLGEHDLDNVDIVIRPCVPTGILPVDIDIIDVNGVRISGPTIELRAVKVGEEVLQLSNDHQNSPLRFSWISLGVDDPGKLSIEIASLGSNAYVARDTLRFWQSFMAGGTLRFIYPTLNNTSSVINLQAHPENIFSQEYMELVDKLCKIQDKTCQFVRIPVAGLSDKDVQAIHELIEIIEHGKTTTQYSTFEGEFNKQALNTILDLHRLGQQAHFSLFYEESCVDLLDSEIQTGRMVRYVTGKIEMSVANLQKAVTILDPHSYLSLKLNDVEVVEIFPDWFIREAEWLSKQLIEKFDAEEVYLFGSLAWSDDFTPETDIDLAIRGLPAERYLEAVSYLKRESNFPVDLVDVDKVPDHLRQRIVREGKVLSERAAVAAFG